MRRAEGKKNQERIITVSFSAHKQEEITSETNSRKKRETTESK